MYKALVMVNGVLFNMTLPKNDYKAERAARALQELSNAEIDAVRGSSANTCILQLCNTGMSVLRWTPEIKNEYLRKNRDEIAENASNLISSDTEIITAGMDDMGKKQSNRYLIWIAFGVVLVVLAGAGIVFWKKEVHK